jgi:hypothetical protein
MAIIPGNNGSPARAVDGLEGPTAGSPVPFPSGFTGSLVPSPLSDADATLTSANSIVVMTPTANRTLTLPSSVPSAAFSITVINRSPTFTIALNASGGGTVVTVGQGQATVLSTQTNPTTTAHWTISTNNAVLQGGNSFGAAMTIGTNDNFGLDFETNGVIRLGINAAGLATFNNGLTASGTVTLPATVNYTGVGSIVKSGVGALTISNANASTLSIPTTGTYTFPSVVGTLVGSGDTGTVTSAMLAGSIADSKLSTITTAGKIANSATTATSANTASAIVARDASGNFSAGTITANLNGNATTASSVSNITQGTWTPVVTGTFTNVTANGRWLRIANTFYLWIRINGDYSGTYDNSVFTVTIPTGTINSSGDPGLISGRGTFNTVRRSITGTATGTTSTNTLNCTIDIDNSSLTNFNADLAITASFTIS